MGTVIPSSASWIGERPSLEQCLRDSDCRHGRDCYLHVAAVEKSERKPCFDSKGPKGAMIRMTVCRIIYYALWKT
jgi:hypothetical protein